MFLLCRDMAALLLRAWMRVVLPWVGWARRVRFRRYFGLSMRARTYSIVKLTIWWLKQIS